jgi:hypothetical protein
MAPSCRFSIQTRKTNRGWGVGHVVGFFSRLLVPPNSSTKLRMTSRCMVNGVGWFTLDDFFERTKIIRLGFINLNRLFQISPSD